MNLYEIDWRYSSTLHIFEVLTESLKDVVAKLHEAEQSDDELYFDFVLEQAEGLCGIAFVAAQRYITGTVADVKKLAYSDNRFKKDALLKVYNDRLLGLSLTKLEFCDAMANYFKHHEEWQRWAGVGQKQKTVGILQAAGLKESDSYLCVRAIHILLSQDEWNLMPLLNLLSSWRESIIGAYKQQ
jgi:hypothetical protein